MKIDFHLHTNYSHDSTISLDTLAKKSKEFGIVPSITDHNTMSAVSKFKKFGIDFIPGEEILVSTPSGHADLIGLFMNEEIPKKTEFYEALDRIKSQGAISYAPHAFDPLRAGLMDKGLLKKVEVIEIFNSHCLSNFDAEAEAFAEKEHKLRAAGSDAHFPFEFGSTYVELELDELEPKKLLKALKNGKIVGKRSSKFRRIMHRVGSGLSKPFI